MNAQQEFEKEFNKSEITNERDSSQDTYWDHEYLKINEIFPSFFRQTTFIGLYSFLETRLHSLCDNLQRFKNYDTKISESKGKNYIEKSKTYLKLVAGLDLDDLNTEWTKIKNYQKIRNCFVHCNGNVMADKSQPLDKQKFFAPVKSNINLGIEVDGTIKILNNNFLLNFINVIEIYLRSLLDKLKNHLGFVLDFP